MVETLELRILEEHFGEPFRPNEGKLLGDLVRRVTLSTSDPRLPLIAEQQKLWKRRDSFLFAGWIYHRKYSRLELESAECFKLDITAVFEPTGEECGTIYDNSAACRHVFAKGQKCGVGEKQVSDLFLDLRKVPKRKDIARTIADEWIISQRLAELMTDAKLTGFELRRVRHKSYFRDDPVRLETLEAGGELLRQADKLGLPRTSWGFDVWLARSEQRRLWERAIEQNVEKKKAREARRKPNHPAWYQLVITSPPVPVIAPTKFGLRPFDEDPEGRYRCPSGHVAGLNLLSEVTLSRAGWDGSDLARTREMVGVRGGVGRPHPILLGSPELWRLFSQNSVRGVKFEIAHLS